MKTIRVVAAVILSEGKIFATQRGYGDFKGAGNFQEGRLKTVKLKRLLLREKSQKSWRQE